MSINEIERRTTFADTSVEFRDAGDGEKRPTIVGYASVFNSESRNLGGFVETVHPRAFDDVLSSNPDVLGLYNHDKNKLLARSGNGSLKLSVDPRGLRYEMSLPATRDAEDVAIMVKEGLVTGSSFAFAVRRNGGDVWTTDDRGMKRREIRSVALLEDVGPVVRPAYDASSVVVSRRALEIALGENFRPNQTMANAARRGLRAAEKRDDVDSRLLVIAERLVNREIVSVEEVSYLWEVHQRAAAARAADWTGSPAHVEWLLAGGESGEKWCERRTAPQEAAAVVPGEEPTSDEEADHRAEGDVNLKPTAGMAAACRRGLKLYEEGRGGDGLVPATIAWARKIAARENLTKEKVVKMRAWHARHKVDKKPGWDKPGEETPGFVAFLLWAGAPGARWSSAKVAQMERGERRDAEGDTSIEEDYGTLSPANVAYVESLEDIVDEYGPWPQGGPAGAHYIEVSPFAARGMKCSNCVFFEAGACEVVQGSISEDGICKLWVIPEGAMSEESKRSTEVVSEDATTPEESSAVASEESAPADDALAAKVKLAELNAVLLRTRLQTSNAGR